MSNEPEIFEILRKIRYDLTAAQTKVTEALNTLGSMDLPSEPDGLDCPICGVNKRGERALAIHITNVHGGPAVPMAADELAAL
jgi:hypothetical protein